MKLRVIFRMSNAAGKRNFMYPDKFIGPIPQVSFLAIAKSPSYFRIGISRSDSN